jgi:hypothetical protein
VKGIERLLLDRLTDTLPRLNVNLIPSFPAFPSQLMRRFYALALAILLSGIASPKAVATGIIGQFDLTIGWGLPSSFPVYLSLAYTPNGTPSPWPALFETIPITTQSIGMSFSASKLNDPDFAAITGHLTNGADEVLSMFHFFNPNLAAPGSGVGQAESALFVNGHPDLSGYQVSEISMNIKDLSLSQNLAAWIVSAHFTVWGVPEPSTLLIGASSIIIWDLVLRRRLPVRRPHVCSHYA